MFTVEMRKITKRFDGVLANDRIDFQVRAGEVHALLGENGAGKSTLMNILAGLHTADSGQIYVEGRHVVIRSPSDAMRLGIGMVHQHFMLIEPMTVVENFLIGLPGTPLVPNRDTLKQEIGYLSGQYGLWVEPDAFIWQLSVGEQQRVELLRLLHRGATILILDEPTAVLTPQESRELGKTLRNMAQTGKTVIVITHKLDEVMEFSDHVTVLRDGQAIASMPTAHTNPTALARLMLGRELTLQRREKASTPGGVVLDVDQLVVSDDRGLPAIKGVTFSVREGGMFGIAGVAGNGQRELVEAIVGLRRVQSGTIRIRGVVATNATPRQIIAWGVSYIPLDRIHVGSIDRLSVADNLVLKEYRTWPLSWGPFLWYRNVWEFARRLIGHYGISTTSVKTPVAYLSGGNIQRLILAREVSAHRGIIVAEQPTRGLDVGALQAVHEILRTERDRGAAILLVSEDLEELLALSDRVGVLYRGELTGIVDPTTVKTQDISMMMSGTRMGVSGGA